MNRVGNGAEEGQRVAGEAIFEIGRRLKHVKENDLAHGQWERWCSEQAGLSPSAARKMMTVYERLNGSNRSTSNDTGLDALYLIATLPPEERERPHTIPSTGEVKTVDEMTVRELREVKKALKEAELLTFLSVLWRKTSARKSSGIRRRIALR